jgi:hypothetical protein
LLASPPLLVALLSTAVLPLLLVLRCAVVGVRHVLVGRVSPAVAAVGQLPDAQLPPEPGAHLCFREAGLGLQGATELLAEGLLQPLPALRGQAAGRAVSLVVCQRHRHVQHVLHLQLHPLLPAVLSVEGVSRQGCCTALLSLGPCGRLWLRVKLHGTGCVPLLLLRLLLLLLCRGRGCSWATLLCLLLLLP